EINIGDLVLSSDVLYHDMDATSFGYPLGQVPRMEVLSFEADKNLLSLAKECCEKVNSEVKTFIGRVVSGDQFVSNKEKKDWILKKFNGCCTEMEGAAIAHTAYLNQIPFVIIRAISDKADDGAQMDYPVFEALAIERSVKLIMEMAGEYE
ncbi:MAG: 5'-methylthioadenosine/S-adenosylhomocysteine nucleosidase, partial [Acetivibrio sp.]